MERAIQVFTAVNFFVIGISHILQRSVWVEYFPKTQPRPAWGICRRLPLLEHRCPDRFIPQRLDLS